MSALRWAAWRHWRLCQGTRNAETIGTGSVEDTGELGSNSPSAGGGGVGLMSSIFCELVLHLPGGCSHELLEHVAWQ